MDIGGWLRSLGLEEYKAAFRENKVDASVLPIRVFGGLTRCFRAYRLQKNGERRKVSQRRGPSFRFDAFPWVKRGVTKKTNHFKDSCRSASP